MQTIAQAEPRIDPGFFPSQLDSPIPLPSEPEALADGSPVLSEDDLPAPRIRFSAPVELRLEGLDSPNAAAVINLSRSGLALVSDAELNLGQRVWASFRLNLTDEPVAYLCRVAWRKSSGFQNLYGCEFAGLSAAERTAIDQLVEARTFGVEAEWSLPVLPVVEFENPPVSKESPSSRKGGWLYWSVGGAVGFICALLVVNGYSQSPVSQTAEAAENVVETPPIRVATDDGSIGLLAKEASERDSLEADSQETPMAAKTPSLELELPASEDRGHRAVVTTTDVGVQVDLQTGFFKSHRSFWLEEPRRFVLDVRGVKERVNPEEYQFSHPLIGKVRIGRHPDKVRFVFEIADEVRAAELSDQSQKRIRIEFLRGQPVKS